MDVVSWLTAVYLAGVALAGVVVVLVVLIGVVDLVLGRSRPTVRGVVSLVCVVAAVAVWPVALLVLLVSYTSPNPAGGYGGRI